MKKDRLFLDANILFSAAYSKNSGLLQLWKLKTVKLFSSLYAIEEARRNLDAAQKVRLDKLLLKIDICPSFFEEELPKNITIKAKDRPILLTAIAIQADYLITGDKRDFGQFYGKDIKGLKVMPPADYFKKISPK